MVCYVNREREKEKQIERDRERERESKVSSGAATLRGEVVK